MSYTPSDYSEAPQFFAGLPFLPADHQKPYPNSPWKNYYLDLRYFFRFIAQRRGIIPKDQPLDEADISGLDFSVVQSVTLTDIYAFFNHLTATGDGVRTRSRKASAIADSSAIITTSSRSWRSIRPKIWSFPMSKAPFPIF